jgi:hypothetical protein
MNARDWEVEMSRWKSAEMREIEATLAAKGWMMPLISGILDENGMAISYQSFWNGTPQGRALRAAWNNSPEGRASKAKYDRTAAGIAWKLKYEQSAKRKAARARYKGRRACVGVRHCSRAFYRVHGFSGRQLRTPDA